MERVITWIASGIALAILVLLPAGYYALQSRAIDAALRVEAEATAQQITQIVNADPELWRFQIDRLDAILARRAGDGVPESRRLVDMNDAVIAAAAQVLDEPLATVALPVHDSGRVVAQVQVDRSLRPAVLGSALAAMVAALLSGAVFAALRLLPMRALRRAERKARELSDHAAWLEQAHRDAVAEARLKTHVLARLTHEIRTPLGGLLGMTESLRATSLSDSQRLQAQRAHESSAALLQVVNDILEYSHDQGSDLVLAHEHFDPVLLVEGVIELMTPQAAAAKLTLYYEVGPGLPAQIEGDPGRLRQVLNNLVSNAIKYTPRGDVKINIKWNAATPSVPANIYFEVRDTGVGLSAQDQARLFAPVPHVESGASRRQGGMGLAICRQLIESMGGHIGLHSTPGQGSRFWFDLPQKQASIALPQPWPTDAAGAPLHALVADPHIGRARAMCSRLMAMGLRVNAVHTADALRTVLAKPGLRFTHVLVLASLGVRPDEARWLAWITMHDGASSAPAPARSEGAVLNLPCRRDDLVRVLQETTPRPVVTEVPRAIASSPRAVVDVTDLDDELPTVPAPAAMPGAASAPPPASRPDLAAAAPPARPAEPVAVQARHAAAARDVPSVAAANEDDSGGAASRHAPGRGDADAPVQRDFADLDTVTDPVLEVETPAPAPAPAIRTSRPTFDPPAPTESPPLPASAQAVPARDADGPDEADTASDAGSLDGPATTPDAVGLDEPDTTPDAGARALQPPADPAAPPSVLLVESNEVSQEMGRALLESMGCDVYVADDGHTALQRLPQGFGLILLDLQIQGMDGYTTASEIRRWEALQPTSLRTPLVALAADDNGDVRQRCVAAGVDDIIGKPVDRQLLRETLERYLPMLIEA